MHRLAAAARLLIRGSSKARRPARSGNDSALEVLEPRAMMSATTGPNLVTPYQHDTEWDRAAFVADFTADARPVAAYVGWGDGDIDNLIDTNMMDYERASNAGRLYGLHQYDDGGTYTVTLTVKGADGWLSAQSYSVTATTESDGPVADAAASSAFAEIGSDSAIASADAGVAQAAAVATAGPPRVKAVFIDSVVSPLGDTAPRWSPDGSAFRAFNSSALANGYPVPTGAGQLSTLPWTNMNQVKVQFTEDVTVVKEDLLLKQINAQGTAVDVSPATFAYDPATSTASWTLAPNTSLENGKYLIHLRNTIADTDELNELDGDWTDSASTFPSGDGVNTDGDNLFQFRFNVLPGDVSRNGAVNSIDLTDTHNRLGKTAGAPGTGTYVYTQFHDVDGSGAVNSSDEDAVRVRQATALPPGEPAKPMLPASPTGFTATWVNDANQVRGLNTTITPDDPNLTYRIEKSRDGATRWSTVNYVLTPGQPNIRRIQDEDVQRKYYYRFRSVNSAGASSATASPRRTPEYSSAEDPVVQVGASVERSPDTIVLSWPKWETAEATRSPVASWAPLHGVYL